ncbi:MAG: rhomboid family intramembrane serine protease [Taibaiella sp.]|nr:rhomboid family intramembrane serine protease [Taibaiella sp.]
MTVTIILIIFTGIITYLAFTNTTLLNKLIMYPYGMTTPGEYYRLLTSGFIHADWNHLIFNMFTLYFFGVNCEMILQEIQPGAGGLGLFALLYISAIIISSLPALFKHKNDSYYRSLGASGGVSAILFFSIYYMPWSKIMIFFIPIGIPAIVYAILYSLYSYYMSKKGMDNIGHDAHLGGGIYGFLFAFLVDPTHGQMLLEQLRHPQF